VRFFAQKRAIFSLFLRFFSFLCHFVTFFDFFSTTTPIFSPKTIHAIGKVPQIPHTKTPPFLAQKWTSFIKPHPLPASKNTPFCLFHNS